MSAVEYRDIPGFPGYRVGEDGSVWSQLRRGPGSSTGGWHRFKPYPRMGYPSVGIRCSGIRRNFTVHSLVLTSFVGPCPIGQECRHLDGNRLNPALSNLAWGTKIENAGDRAIHGTQCRGETCGRHKLVAAQVGEIRQLRKRGMSSSAIARKFGVSPSVISSIDLGQSWREVA